MVNLHATSAPALVVPWLWAQCTLRRVDAVLLQECTPRHARWLRHRRRWQLVRDGSDEAIYARRQLVTDHLVIDAMSPAWWGHQASHLHPGRKLPLVELAGWLELGSVHFPPGWETAGSILFSGRRVGQTVRQDRVKAGLRYGRALERVGHSMGPAAFLAGDWNALPGHRLLVTLRAVLKLTATGDRIDHAATRGCTVTRWRSIGRAPGMDHRAWLAVVREGDT